MELRLERWRGCLEKGGLKLTRTKTEHLIPTGKTENIMLKKYNKDTYTELPQTTSFRYLGITRHQDGGCRAKETNWKGVGHVEKFDRKRHKA